MAELEPIPGDLAFEDEFRTVFDVAPIGILRLELADGSVRANPALVRMLGYPAAELAALGPKLFDALLANAHDPFACDTYRVEQRLERRHGSPIWTQVTAKLARHADGTPAYALGMVEDISRRKEAEEALRLESERNEHQALHDPLTGLANRTLFRDRIEHAAQRAEREGSSLAVLIMDVDRFKEINDSLGHQAGDAFLNELAARLHGVLRRSDTVARLGGDEFGLLMPDRGGQAEVEEAIERIVDAVERPVVLDGVPLVVEVSIGVARFPEDGADVDTLLRHADVAMYAAKRSSFSHAFYDGDADVHDRGRLQLVGELRRAIDERELVLHFQPKARLSTGEVRSVEALLRWQHPERGLVLPEGFLPLAQETSLMTPLTLYVVEEALRACRDWQARGVTLSAAVNVTRRNLLDVTFAEQVGELLARSGLEPATLELEISESAMLGEQGRVDEVLGQLATLGVRLSIDDFGTGYSSLSHLTRLPISEIKIDRSFVGAMTHDRNAAVIVRSVVELAKSLRLDAVAEGVESREVWRRLRRHGCTLAQGDYLTPPLPAEELLHWLGKRGIMAAA